VDRVEYTMTEENNEQLAILIKFDSDRPDMFSITYSGDVSPYQLLSVASYLEFEGKYAFSKGKQAREILEEEALKKKLSVAKPGILTPQ